jgi:hypothetical protein
MKKKRQNLEQNKNRGKPDEEPLTKGLIKYKYDLMYSSYVSDKCMFVYTTPFRTKVSLENKYLIVMLLYHCMLQNTDDEHIVA